MTQSPRLPLETWGRLWLERIKARADRAAWSRYCFEFLMFGFKQAWACLFGGLMLLMIVGTFLLWPDEATISRYDFLVVGALAIQAGMLIFKLESWEEARVFASSVYMLVVICRSGRPDCLGHRDDICTAATGSMGSSSA